LDGNFDQVVIPAGQSSAAVHLHALTNPSGRKAKTVKLKLTNNAAYKLPRRAGKAATVKIANPAR